MNQIAKIRLKWNANSFRYIGIEWILSNNLIESEHSEINHFHLCSIDLFWHNSSHKKFLYGTTISLNGFSRVDFKLELRGFRFQIFSTSPHKSANSYRTMQKSNVSNIVKRCTSLCFVLKERLFRASVWTKENLIFCTYQKFPLCFDIYSILQSWYTLWKLT